MLRRIALKIPAEFNYFYGERFLVLGVFDTPVGRSSLAAHQRGHGGPRHYWNGTSQTVHHPRVISPQRDHDDSA
jgi:hypothetical protein